MAGTAPFLLWENQPPKQDASPPALFGKRDGFSSHRNNVKGKQKDLTSDAHRPPRNGLKLSMEITRTAQQWPRAPGANKPENLPRNEQKWRKCYSPRALPEESSLQRCREALGLGVGAQGGVLG